MGVAFQELYVSLSLVRLALIPDSALWNSPCSRTHGLVVSSSVCREERHLTLLI